jgi:hypothetical protein
MAGILLYPCQSNTDVEREFVRPLSLQVLEPLGLTPSASMVATISSFVLSIFIAVIFIGAN